MINIDEYEYMITKDYFYITKFSSTHLRLIFQMSKCTSIYIGIYSFIYNSLPEGNNAALFNPLDLFEHILASWVNVLKS